LPKELDINAPPIIENHLVLIAPLDHPFADKSNLTWADLGGERFLIREKGSGTRFAVERFFKQHKWDELLAEK
jgi:DNA-binding transcriptional LysR family regulator